MLIENNGSLSWVMLLCNSLCSTLLENGSMALIKQYTKAFKSAAKQHLEISYLKETSCKA